MDIPGLNLLGSAISSIGNYFGTKDTNATNMQLGREQMDFQKEMSGTAYQRAVTDMQAAGLNPMLAYSQGGASTPIGSMPQVQNAIGNAVSGAQQGMQMMQGLTAIDQSQAQTDLLKAQADSVRADTWETDLASARRHAEVATTQSRIKNIEQEGKNLSLDEQRKLEEVLSARYNAMSTARQYEADMNDRSTYGDLRNTAFGGRARAAMTNADLMGLKVPEAQAWSDFWQSKPGKNTPYVEKGAELVGKVLNIGKGLRMPK